MKRSLLLLAPLFVAACGGGTVELAVSSDDAGENAQALGAGAMADLSTVKSVKLTVNEIWVHVAGSDAKDDVKGEDVDDSAKGWELVSEKEHAIDLMTVRNQATQPLGEVSVPEGKVTQIRLRLKATDEAGDKVRIASAVEETDGTVCDLYMPKSAINPGVKISGILKAMKIESGGKHEAVLNLKLKESSKLTGTACAYHLNPVLKVKKFSTKE